MSGPIDPEVAQLLGIEEEEKSEASKPDFEALFGGEGGEKSPSEPEAVDAAREKFAPISQLEGKPKPYFQDKHFYKRVLSDAGEQAKKLHTLLSQFIQAKDTQDKSLFRARLLPTYWEFAANVAVKIGSKIPTAKRLLLRFGLLSPTFISAEQRSLISRIIWENKTGEPIYYLDEWMKMIASGSLLPSETDEIKVAQKDTTQRQIDIIEKRKGRRDGEITLLRNKLADMSSLESKLQTDINAITAREVQEDTGLASGYSPEQKQLLSGLSEQIRRLQSLDREAGQAYSSVENLKKEIEELVEKTDMSEAASIDASTIREEFNTVKQMNKMCVGRQGNHFPILMKQYFRSNIMDICTRENIINQLAAIEKYDPEVFLRTFKGQTTRIVPNILILPCYGDQGVCWEPFSRVNRATSRGRVAIPFFPKDMKEAIMGAVANLRWQVAKEKAQHYWMEEGITGRYYQWFQEQKLKGDVRDSFIKDYMLWHVWETQGTQKLDKDVRGIFWRMMPFPQDVKEDLKNRGFVYNELYKKDVNISKSDGY